MSVQQGLTVNIMRPMTPYLNWEKLGEGGALQERKGVSRQVTRALIIGDL